MRNRTCRILFSIPALVGCLACNQSAAPAGVATAGAQGTQPVTPVTGAAGIHASTPTAGVGTSTTVGTAGVSVAQAGVTGTTSSVAGSTGAAAGSAVVAGATGGAGVAGSTVAGSTAADSGGSSAGASGSAAAGGAAPALTCQSSATLKPGETTETLMVGGVARTYILHVPTSYTGAAPVPLLVDWHPILAQASFEKGNSGYLALAESEGFIVAYPQGIDNAWNIGPCCTTSRTVDDLGFAKAVVTAIETKGCVDTKRVYAAGFSMGGGMSHYLACNAADIFAAVVPSAFDLLADTEEPCHPARAISVMSFRDTGDPIVPYAGGASMPPNGLAVTIHFLGAVATWTKWSQLNSCTDMPKDTGSGCQTYSQCKDGVEVTLCTKQGGTHETGDSTSGWAFLKKHPMP